MDMHRFDAGGVGVLQRMVGSSLGFPSTRTRVSPIVAPAATRYRGRVDFEHGHVGKFQSDMPVWLASMPGEMQGG
jgi:hypothetical protein